VSAHRQASGTTILARRGGASIVVRCSSHVAAQCPCGIVRLQGRKQIPGSNRSASFDGSFDILLRATEALGVVWTINGLVGSARSSKLILNQSAG
jgi:hypothetical protein